MYKIGDVYKYSNARNCTVNFIGKRIKIIEVNEKEKMLKVELLDVAGSYKPGERWNQEMEFNKYNCTKVSEPKSHFPKWW
jgi:hypothetical protein